MSYEHIRIAGNLTEGLEAWLVRRYGNVVDLEVGGINEGDYAAFGYAAVETPEAGAVEAVVILLKHDPDGGADRYLVKDMAESEGPSIFVQRGSSTSSHRRRTIWPITGGCGAGNEWADKVDGPRSH